MPVLAGPAQRLLPLQLHLNRSVWKVPHLPRWMTASSMMIQISIRAPQTLRAATMTNITPLKPMGNRKMGARALLQGCTHLLHTSGRHAVKDRLVQREGMVTLPLLKESDGVIENAQSWNASTAHRMQKSFGRSWRV